MNDLFNSINKIHTNQFCFSSKTMKSKSRNVIHTDTHIHIQMNAQSFPKSNFQCMTLIAVAFRSHLVHHIYYTFREWNGMKKNLNSIFNKNIFFDFIGGFSSFIILTLYTRLDTTFAFYVFQLMHILLSLFDFFICFLLFRCQSVWFEGAIVNHFF